MNNMAELASCCLPSRQFLTWKKVLFGRVFRGDLKIVIYFSSSMMSVLVPLTEHSSIYGRMGMYVRPWQNEKYEEEPTF